jgi:hypothetical protein
VVPAAASRVAVLLPPKKPIESFKQFLNNNIVPRIFITLFKCYALSLARHSFKNSSFLHQCKRKYTAQLNWTISPFCLALPKLKPLRVREGQLA